MAKVTAMAVTPMMTVRRIVSERHLAPAGDGARQVRRQALGTLTAAGVAG
jgi:hypothetical protein